MEITFPYAQVFVDDSNLLSVFFRHDAEHSSFRQIGAIGNGIVDFCELDFVPALEKMKALQAVEAVSANADAIRKVCWDAVDLLKEQHSYVHFFLNGELLRNFYVSERTLSEQTDYACFLFRYYAEQQALYREALELCLSTEVLAEYTLPERYVIFGNRHPDFQHGMLRTMYGIAPVSRGRFDAKKVIAVQNADETDTRGVLQNLHRDSDHAVSMQQYFVVQDLGEMLFLELMEAVKRGIRVKRCALCDRYFALPDRRKREYCGREGQDGRTCQEKGPGLNFHKTVKEDQYLQKFQQFYNRMYSRYYREDDWESDRPTKKLSKEAFDEWIAAASAARRDYRAGKIDGTELLRRISEPEDLA